VIHGDNLMRSELSEWVDLGMLTAVYMHKTYTLYIQNHCKNISRNDSPLINFFFDYAIIMRS
jgi:hypothetical protein